MCRCKVKRLWLKARVNAVHTIPPSNNFILRSLCTASADEGSIYDAAATVGTQAGKKFRCTHYPMQAACFAACHNSCCIEPKPR